MKYVLYVNKTYWRTEEYSGQISIGDSIIIGMHCDKFVVHDIEHDFNANSTSLYLKKAL